MVLSTQNCGKYLTRTYERDKNAGELDSSTLTDAEIEYLEIQDGEGAIKGRLERDREETDGILYLH